MSIRFYEEKPQPARSMDESDSGSKKLLDKIKLWKQSSDSLVGDWETSQEKWHKMRMRIKKKKTFPFVGCANIRMPTIETKIRKLKAALMNTIFGMRPIVQVVPSPSGSWESAKKIEKFLDHLTMDKMKIKNKCMVAIDQMLEKGFYLIKPTWRVEITTRVEDLSLDDITLEEAQWLFADERTREEVSSAIAAITQADLSEMVKDDNQKEIERVADEILSGSDSIKFTLQDVLYNCPDISLCSPERVYVPTTSGYNPQDCQYIIHEFFMPFNTVKQTAEYKKWDIDGITEINDKKSVDLEDKNIDITKDQREGIERLQSASELIKIWECYCWYDINDDGTAEKCVITIAPDFDKVLREITLPFYSGKFPFVKLFYELTDDRWFSHRGIPELIEDIVKEIDISHMQKLDYQTMSNSPTYVYRAGQVNANATPIGTFGLGISVSGLSPLKDTIDTLNRHNPNVEFSYEREQMLLETKIEELVGQPDFTLQSMINKRQPRTLGEVELQNQNMQQVFSLDADMLREGFNELLNWIYDLWSQYGDDEYSFLYLGNTGNPQGEKIKLSREETQSKYQITIRGNDQNTNPQVKVQKAQAIMAGLNNQAALATGVITPYHIAQAYKRFYQELDIPNWEELVTTPEQIAQQMKQQQQMAERNKPDDIKFKADDLTDAEKAQALAKRGIQPDIQGRMLNEKNRRREKGFDQLMEVASEVGKQTAAKKASKRKDSNAK